MPKIRHWDKDGIKTRSPSNDDMSFIKDDEEDLIVKTDIDENIL